MKLFVCAACGEFVDGDSGWIKEPNGARYCWPCYESGQKPDAETDHESSVAHAVSEHIPFKAKRKITRAPRPEKARWGTDIETGEITEVADLA